MTHRLAAMLDARSIAVVGASARPDSFGARMVAEVGRSADHRIHLVNPRYDSIDGRPCLPSLKDVDEPIDLVLLGVGDAHLRHELSEAARIGARSAVVFGSAVGDGLRDDVRAIADEAAMPLCGGGCMGFLNVAKGLRAVGYLERDVLPVGPIALVTHSGSVFSTLLRTRRPLGFTLAVSSGQELVTTTADYVDYVLDETDAGVLALVLETARDGPRLVRALARAKARDIPVVLLPVGRSPLGASMVQAHSGAVAGDRAMWEALAETTGALLVHDLAELTDLLELLTVGRRTTLTGAGVGIATVHDSGAERTLVTDLADELGVPFASLAPATRTRIAGLLDDGLEAANPLDVWGRGADTETMFAGCLQAMADDPHVAAVALAVDLVPEFDGDTSYPDAVLAVSRTTEKPLAVLTNLACAIDEVAAARLRAAGVPVLEGTRSGLAALGHLLKFAAPRDEPVVVVDWARRARWLDRLSRPLGSGDSLGGADSLALLADYGIAVSRARAADTADGAVAVAPGYPVVLKTDQQGIAHKSNVGGVRLAIADPAGLRAAYADMAARLGPRVLLCESVAPGVELSVGLTRDRQLGLLVVLAAGGTLVELLADRVVALPPLTPGRVTALLDRLRMRPMFDGWRGAPAADLHAIVRAVLGISQLAVELGDRLEALDVNPLIVSATGAVAVDALVLPVGD